jgi:hypothetical protein
VFLNFSQLEKRSMFEDKEEDETLIFKLNFGHLNSTKEDD